MIFISYSHENPQWLLRWQMMSKPMAKANGMEFWSDKKLQVGKWKEQIDAAMKNSEAVVLLVSAAFLASDFIMDHELPYFLNANEKEKKQIFWMLLEPCDMNHNPAKKIRELQAITLDGNLKALSEMKDADWQKTMVRGCEIIDGYLKGVEKPIIHAEAKRKPKLNEKTENFQLLDKPARRRVEVLVFSGGKWWRQQSINRDSVKTSITLGDSKTKPGTEFKVIVITTGETLNQSFYLNPPESRTKQEIILLRK